MADDVFINKLSAIHKGSPGKSMAFPDVNLCPPSPPAGPVPTPLPNIAAAKDLAGGATSVKIHGNPVAKKSSYFAKSTGNAMARSTGGGIVTHVVEGKAYFASFSMNVKIEGEPVPRHLDMMTHNHAAPSPGEAVGTYMGSMKMAMPKGPLIPEPKERKEDGKPFDYEILVGKTAANDGDISFVLRSTDGAVEKVGEKGPAKGDHVTLKFRDVPPAKMYSLFEKQGSLEWPIFSALPSTKLVNAVSATVSKVDMKGTGEKAAPAAEPLEDDEIEQLMDDALKGGA